MTTKQIDGYELTADLGRGAWGRTFRAHQVSLDRVVRLTLLADPQEGGPSDAIAQNCAALSHPNLVSGIDYGRTEAGRFLVTEWVEGATVFELVARNGPSSEEAAVRLVLEVARGLAHASKKGLVHGRVDPSAILIDAGRTPKLRGYGPDRDELEDAIEFRSPERRRNRALDGRSDLYSLGLILHHLLTGASPLAGSAPAAVVDGSVIERPAALATPGRRLQTATIDLATSMTAPRREDRLESATVLVPSLEEILGGANGRAGRMWGRSGAPAVRRTRSRRRRR